MKKLIRLLSSSIFLLYACHQAPLAQTAKPGPTPASTPSPELPSAKADLWLLGKAELSPDKDKLFYVVWQGQTSSGHVLDLNSKKSISLAQDDWEVAQAWWLDQERVVILQKQTPKNQYRLVRWDLPEQRLSVLATPASLNSSGLQKRGSYFYFLSLPLGKTVTTLKLNALTGETTTLDSQIPASLYGSDSFEQDHQLLVSQDQGQILLFLGKLYGQAGKYPFQIKSTAPPPILDMYHQSTQTTSPSRLSPVLRDLKNNLIPSPDQSKCLLLDWQAAGLEIKSADLLKDKIYFTSQLPYDTAQILWEDSEHWMALSDQPDQSEGQSIPSAQLPQQIERYRLTQSEPIQTLRLLPPKNLLPAERWASEYVPSAKGFITYSYGTEFSRQPFQLIWYPLDFSKNEVQGQLLLQWELNKQSADQSQITQEAVYLQQDKTGEVLLTRQWTADQQLPKSDQKARLYRIPLPFTEAQELLSLPQ